MQRNRGFTLIEILVVITILLILTALVIAAFRGNEAQKVRDGGRSVQSSILAARDRALHAGKMRGIRINRDPSDTNLGVGLSYVQPLDYLAYGPNAISLERIDLDGDSIPDPPADVTIVRGVAGTDWASLSQFFPTNPRIRINGKWYFFDVLMSGPYALSAANPVLRLTTPFEDNSGSPGNIVAFNTTSAYASCELDIGNELLPLHQPMSLPTGVVFDLNNSSPAARGDIMFSPRGMITGPVVAQGPIYLLLRDIRDVTEGINPANMTAGIVHRDMLIVAIFPQTGHVQNFPVDMTDSDANGTADDLFRFAKLGSAAGG